MKNLTLADVYDVAFDLIEVNGAATTLGIKNELRKRGFFAKQADVSEFMMEIAEEENWQFAYNGVHRIYSFDTDVDIETFIERGMMDEDDHEDDHEEIDNDLKEIKKITQKHIKHKFTCDKCNDTKSYIKRDGTLIETIDESDITYGDYRVWSTSDSDELYFPGCYTRSEVRYAYAKITNTDYNDTRVATI